MKINLLITTPTTILIFALLFTLNSNANKLQIGESINIGTKDTIPEILQIDMITIDEGGFDMGISNPSEDDKMFYPDAIPAHRVELSGYQIAMLPVNEALWEKVMGTTVLDQAEKHGVDLDEVNIQKDGETTMRFISWMEVNDFIKKLNELTGKSYRLPTEAEWEYASHLSSLKTLSMSGGISAKNGKEQKRNRILLFNQFVEGMEWCSDWHDDNYYSVSPIKNPIGADNGKYKIRRGWAKHSIEPEPIKSNRYRSALLPEKGAYNLGFRLAHD